LKDKYESNNFIDIAKLILKEIQEYDNSISPNEALEQYKEEMQLSTHNIIYCLRDINKNNYIKETLVNQDNELQEKLKVQEDDFILVKNAMNQTNDIIRESLKEYNNREKQQKEINKKLNKE